MINNSLIIDSACTCTGLDMHADITFRHAAYRNGSINTMVNTAQLGHYDVCS